jgi:hypothetical protein
MPTFPTPNNNTRLGFHYFPDLDHYSERDLRTWLPELKSLGASWITLIAPADRAIPEPFLRGLIEEDIEPVIHFPLSFESFPTARDLAFLFNNYARWGVNYVVLFDRPNIRCVWPKSAWAQTHLVERFMDYFVPLADIALQSELIPVFPPLEPGGDYWDTAFLRSTFGSLLRRGQTELIDRLVLGAYAKAGELPLNWGSGGPEHWPSARPYFTPPGSEDQLGFHTFDWYISITKAVLDKTIPVLLFKAGSRPMSQHKSKLKNMDANTHSLRNLAIAKSLIAGNQPDSLSYLDKSTIDALDTIPSQVLGCNFWLLSTSSQSPHLQHAWFRPDGNQQAIAKVLKNWNIKHKLTEERTGEIKLKNGMSIAPDILNHMSSTKNEEFHPVYSGWYASERASASDLYTQSAMQTN